MCMSHSGPTFTALIHGRCAVLLKLFMLAGTRCAWLMLTMLGVQANAAAAGSEVVVGQILNQSQAWVEAGRDYAAGAKTYFDVVNGAGGVNGHRIVYLTRDTNGTATEIKMAAMALLVDAKADVLFGPIGDSAAHALTDLGSAELNAVIIFAPLTGLRAAKASVLTLRAGYEDEVLELVRHFKGLGLTSFCLVTAPGEKQSAAARAVREAVASTSRALACEAGIAEGGGDARATARTVSSRRPQAVIVLGDTSVLANFAREFPFKQLGISLGSLSLVNHTALMELSGPQVSKGIVLTQVVPSPQRLGVPIVLEHVKAMTKYRDEPPSHLTLEGYMAAKAFVDSLRAGVPARTLRREDIGAALIRNHARTGVNPAASDMGMANAAGTRLVDVTMVRGDGTLTR